MLPRSTWPRPRSPPPPSLLLSCSLPPFYVFRVGPARRVRPPAAGPSCTPSSVNTGMDMQLKAVFETSKWFACRLASHPKVFASKFTPFPSQLTAKTPVMMIAAVRARDRHGGRKGREEGEVAPAAAFACLPARRRPCRPNRPCELSSSTLR